MLNKISSNDRQTITLNIHYYRFEKDYANWNIWMWHDNNPGFSVNFSMEDSFGKVATVVLENMENITEVGFILRKSIYGNDWAERDMHSNRTISLIEPTNSNEIDVFLLEGSQLVAYSEFDINRSPCFLKALLNSPTEIYVELNYPIRVTYDNKEGFYLKSNSTTVSIKQVIPEVFTEEGWARKFKIITNDIIDISQHYEVYRYGFLKSDLLYGNIYDSEFFKKNFTYNGNDLGVTYSTSQTTFKLWAPVAEAVNLLLYSKGINDKVEQVVPMTLDIKGTWVCTIYEDLKNKFYNYEVTINSRKSIATDPYAKAVGVNGIRGAIVDLESTSPPMWNEDISPYIDSYTKAVIYELHVRDLSTHMESGIKNKGKFLGLTETGTKTSTNEKTGLEHIEELGVTHVHLLPCFDFISVDETYESSTNYNWGYDPQNYNVPEGSYSTNPYSCTARILEYKQLVQSLHQKNIGVVMDVVYNHTAETENSHLNLIVPGYYYRKDIHGNFSNASGCGNEIASERPMVRKMIIDSLKYWVKEYHIDGFRFDLMGIHDVDTMNEIQKELNTLKPNILLYGEGWTADVSPLPEWQRAIKSNITWLKNIAFFNDTSRDAIKGSTFDEKNPGFSSGAFGKESIIRATVVGMTNHPQVDNRYTKDTPASQMVNYVSSHDNQTLWDKICATHPFDSEGEKVKVNKLCAAIILTSQGIPFIHAGEELLRTKHGHHNTYNMPDNINQIDWSRKTRYKHVYEYYKHLINLRKKHPAFQMVSGEQIRRHLRFIDNINSPNVVGFILDNHANNDSYKSIAIIYNANPNTVEVVLPYNDWIKMCNPRKLPIDSESVVEGNKVVVSGRSALILADKHSVLQELKK